MKKNLFKALTGACVLLAATATMAQPAWKPEHSFSS